MLDFQNLQLLLEGKRIVERQDCRSGSLHASGVSLVKSLFRQLNSSSPMDSKLHKNLWHTSCPRKINIIISVMIFGSLNCSQTLQRKLPTHSLSPSICPLFCPLCMQNSEDNQHLFFDCQYSLEMWRSYLQHLIFIGFFAMLWRRMWLRL